MDICTIFLAFEFYNSKAIVVLKIFLLSLFVTVKIIRSNFQTFSFDFYLYYLYIVLIFRVGWFVEKNKKCNFLMVD